jgi:hypothetical protein
VNVTDDDRLAASNAIMQAAVDMDRDVPADDDADWLAKHFAAHRIAAEQRGYQRGVEDAAKVCENVYPSADDYDGWEDGKLDCVAAIRALKP